MATDFYIRRNDRLPPLAATLKDADKNAVDLTGATCVFHMRLVTGSELKVNAAATIDANQVTNKGKVSYAWAGGDTDTTGDYYGEFQVTFSDGRIETFPNDDTHINIRVSEELG